MAEQLNTSNNIKFHIFKLNKAAIDSNLTRLLLGKEDEKERKKGQVFLCHKLWNIIFFFCQNDRFE